ncbi:MAG: hypothetical protein A4E49_01996 [Methanosaeta sp. PtaU1.Bin112]|nr:MAG: hypothetical protein A4E49_01996 [Methanosaeta sp. PtaU1.Bin112]
MFYLGEYDEETAKEIRDYLDEAGLKVETRSCLVMDNDTIFTIKDKLSVVKELLKEDGEEYGRSISVLKSALAQATPENFDEIFLKELDPQMVETRDKILAFSKAVKSQDQMVVDQEPKNQESLDQEASDQEAQGQQNPTPEKEDALEFSADEWLDNAISISKARTFARMVFDLNGIKIGEAVENKLDDPIIEIKVDPNDFEIEPEQMKCNIHFYLDKSVVIFVDEFTTPLASELDDEFWDEYPSEAQSLKSLGLLIEKLAMSPSSRKMDFAEFVEECNMTLEDKSDILNVYGEDVAEDLARILEKGGVLKRKGDRLKWKSS